MAVHAPLESLQRSHWNMKVGVPVPVHVPCAPVSVLVAWAVPLTVGAAVLRGAPTTTALWSETAPAEPAALTAVTPTRSVAPRSASATGYCEAVAPSIAAHARPRASQRCHWNASAVGKPAQPPPSVLRVSPGRAVPA